MKNVVLNYICIVLGSILYAISTVVFIFPHSLLLGGTSGISVILNTYLPLSPGNILMGINLLLLIMAFIALGREMAVKSVVGSTLTTVFIGIFENVLGNIKPIENIFLSAVIGAAIIAIASGIMFYVKSSSGGTDIVALIVKKYSKINIGRALLMTDILIVIFGGIISGYIILISSFVGLLVKTLGIDFVISQIKKRIGEK